MGNMSIEHVGNGVINGGTVPYTSHGMNFGTPLGPQLSVPNQMGSYLSPSLEQPIQNSWGFHSIAEGRERKWKEDEKEDDEVRKRNGHTKICARGHWRPHEDAKLKELVAQYGPQNWNLIAQKLEGRSGKSCRLRWFNQLDPRINRRAFTEDEEERLLAAHRMYGNKWALIARLFPGRTDNAVKNHWHVIMARKHREETNVYRRRKPFSSSSKDLISDNTLQKNSACNESNISSNNLDESAASTCTNLSLTPSSTKVPACFSTSFTSSEHHHHLFFGLRIDHEEVMQKRSMVEDHLFCRNVAVVGKAAAEPENPSAQSESMSYSEVSASESVANTKTNISINDKKFENGIDNSNRNMPPFIDFLGVGAI